MYVYMVWGTLSPGLFFDNLRESLSLERYNLGT